MIWPPEYVGEFIRRQELLQRIKNNPHHIYGAKEYYRTNPVEFIEDFCFTYDPRNASGEVPTTLPFCLFPRQKDLVTFLYECIEDSENGLVEKCRDMGASWLACAVSVHLWLFSDGAAIGWGSRKQELVDQLGDMKAIFPKMRFIIDLLPSFLLPIGFDKTKNMSFMKIVNPETGASITGESGDNIGRGGRTLVYFKDESAHYERPELIEAALGDNTNVQIDISSVKGVGNVFYRRRMSGVEWLPGQKIDKGETRVFVMDWRHHPHKTQAWYDQRKARAEREGLSHVFAQEVDRDYTAAVENTIIKGKWLKACIDAHIKLDIDVDGLKFSALDVADGGDDKNAWGYRESIVIRHAETWGDLDTTQTAEKTVELCRVHGVDSLDYDAIGVGSGVKGETNRLKKMGKVPKKLTITPWFGSGEVLFPDKHIDPEDKQSPLNKDFFENLKAQAYWYLSVACYKTYRAVVFGDEYPIDELISFDSKMENLFALEKELCQPTRITSKRGKMMIDKAPEGTRSPNLADMVNMVYTPAKRKLAMKINPEAVRR